MEIKVGDVFGYLEVISLHNSHSRGKSWLCRCACGTERVYYTSSLLGSTDGRVKRSCGCKQKTRNGLVAKNPRLYKTWYAMNSRCYNEKHASYKRYGAKGIRVDDVWRTDFEAFYNWALSSGYQDDLTIDRIDSTKGYSPENCRWATYLTQMQNRGMHRDNKTGVNGSSFTEDGRYRAYIKRNHKFVSLGYYDTAEEAQEARRKAIAYFKEHGTLEGYEPVWNRQRKKRRA